MNYRVSLYEHCECTTTVSWYDRQELLSTTETCPILPGIKQYVLTEKCCSYQICFVLYCVIKIDMLTAPKGNSTPRTENRMGGGISRSAKTDLTDYRIFRSNASKSLNLQGIPFCRSCSVLGVNRCSLRVYGPFQGRGMVPPAPCAHRTSNFHHLVTGFLPVITVSSSFHHSLEIPAKSSSRAGGSTLRQRNSDLPWACTSIYGGMVTRFTRLRT